MEEGDAVSKPGDLFDSIGRRSAKSGTLSRDDWLVGALDCLRARGIEGVHIEPIAKALGVTKGSFYWHFADREELLEGLLDYWEWERTDEIGSGFEHLSSDPAQELHALVELITDGASAGYDASVRAWALHDERAAARVRRVDERRLSYVRSAFLRMGFPADQAEMRSRLSYCCMVGEASVFEAVVDMERRELGRLRHRLLTSHEEPTARQPMQTHNPPRRGRWRRS